MRGRVAAGGGRGQSDQSLSESEARLCRYRLTAERRAVRSVEEQQARVSAAAVAPRPVRVAIAEAQGLMCAEEVVTERPLPGFDQAAIDGYAVRSVDVLGVGESDPSSDQTGDDRLRAVPGEAVESPSAPGGVTLPVMGNIEAGTRIPSRLQPGQAVRVQTGAPLPTLADAVLPLRWTDGGQSRVRVLRGVRSGAYVRRTGDDVQPGDVAVRAGTIIGAAQVGLLAAVGRDRVLVHPRPRVSVLAVGGELVDISRSPGNGQVYDVNSYALAAAGRDAGAEVNRVGIVSNDAGELGEVVEGQLNRAEIVVIAGAVGGAAAEAVRSVLSELGEMEVTRVAMHPGSVQGFGQLGREGVPTFLLPANPVSALVVFEVMVRPLIRLSLGKRQPMRRVVQARTLSPISSVPGRKGFLRGQLMRDQDTGEYLVQALGGAPGASSHLLATLAEANCLVVIPREAEQIRTGEVVDVAFLAQRG
jgi:molybdopterin molybdotransferase